MARTAYGAPGQPTRTLRGTEYELFARITQRLQATRSMGRMEFAQLAQAVYDNRRMWTALATDVAGGENGLPADLRARIFYLAEFTQHHSRKVLSGEATTDVLIDINMAIMRGLRQASATP